MNDKNIHVVNAIIVNDETDEIFAICRRCNKKFIFDKNLNKSSAYYYRCKYCLSFPVFLHDIALSCVIQ